MDFAPITLDAKARIRQQAEWAFDVTCEQLRQNALAEAAYDLFTLYHHDLDTWAFLKGTLGERLLTPQQLVLVEHLFLASRVGSLEELSANVKNIPVYLQFSIRW